MFTYRSRFLKNSLRSNRVYSGLNQIFSYSSSRLARDSCSTIFLYSSQYFSLYSFILSISFKTHGPYAKYSVLFGSEAYKSSLIYNPNRIGGNAVSISFRSFVSTSHKLSHIPFNKKAFFCIHSFHIFCNADTCEYSGSAAAQN